MSVDFDARVADLAEQDIDSVALVGDNDPSFRFYVTDDGHVDISVVETLRFHQELADADHARYGGKYRPWSDFVDAEGRLTSSNSDKLVAELRRLTGVGTIEHDGDLELEGEPSWGVSIRTAYLPGESLAQWHDRIGWPVIAAVRNATDPGTFNYPYLFSAMLYS